MDMPLKSVHQLIDRKKKQFENQDFHDPQPILRRENVNKLPISNFTQHEEKTRLPPTYNINIFLSTWRVFLFTNK